MDIISAAEFTSICKQPTLKTIKYGIGTQPKVFEDENNTIIKLFYPKKRWLTSTRFCPQAIRFQHNVEHLRQHGYEVPAIQSIQYCKDLNTYLVYYPKIIGQDVRSLVKMDSIDLIQKVARFLAELHQQGIIFRAIHLENILLQPNGKFALIDVSDVKFKRRPLTFYTRYRNFVHLFTTELDSKFWKHFGYERFLALYFTETPLSQRIQQLITFLVLKGIR